MELASFFEPAATLGQQGDGEREGRLQSKICPPPNESRIPPRDALPARLQQPLTSIGRKTSEPTLAGETTPPSDPVASRVATFGRDSKDRSGILAKGRATHTHEHTRSDLGEQTRSSRSSLPLSFVGESSRGTAIQFLVPISLIAAKRPSSFVGSFQINLKFSATRRRRWRRRRRRRRISERILLDEARSQHSTRFTIYQPA